MGPLHWVGLDFGDQLSLNDHLRTALPEPDKRERNQCVFLHLAASYEWYLQGRPRRPPVASRVQTAAQQIRQSEYKEALRRSKEVGNSNTHRGYDLLEALHGVLNAHQDRGFGDMDAFLGLIFAQSNISLVVIEINTAMSTPSHRALVFPDILESIYLGRTMTLGVWRSRTRFLPPSAETTPAARADWAATIGSIVHKSRAGWGSSLGGSEDRTTYELTPCRICDQRIRIPPAEGMSVSSGPTWWAEWNPGTHSTPNPLNPECIPTWAPMAFLGKEPRPHTVPTSGPKLYP